MSRVLVCLVGALILGISANLMKDVFQGGGGVTEFLLSWGSAILGMGLLRVGMTRRRDD